MLWRRVKAEHKLAFREDMQSDPTLTDLQKRMISTIATHWNNERMAAECSESFIARGAGTTAKMVKRYKASLVDSGRVSIKRAATWTESTLWDVNWWFRGSAWVRLNNDGQPLRSGGVVPNDAQGVVPVASDGWSPGVQGGGPQAGTQFPLTGEIGAPSGARPYEGAQGAPKKERKENPHKIPAGFAKWKIVHAEYEGEDEDTLVVHLRSGKSRKFVLRCHVDSDDYGSLDAALDIDGEPDSLIGQFVAMSTNPTGSKDFQRAAPFPWMEATVLSGETLENGTAVMRCAFTENDGFKYEGPFRLSAPQAGALFAECGGEDEVIGSRVRYRQMPDDSIEWRKIGGEAA